MHKRCGQAVKLNWFMTETIYVRMIDGTETLIPVKARTLDNERYMIEPFGEFDIDDTSTVPQFIPGDIVTTELKDMGGQETIRIATSLTMASNNRDRIYFEFLYRTITDDKPNKREKETRYKDSVSRVRLEISQGRFHYPAVIDYVKTK